MLPSHWSSGFASLQRNGAPPTLPTLLDGLTGVTLEQAKAWPRDDRLAGSPVFVDGKLFSWDLASELDGDDALIIEPDAGEGRLLALPWQLCVISMPFTFATADAAVLYTVPTGAVLLPVDFWWNITTGFTGGTASAIGVSSTKTNYTTKGDLLGGATGDVAATLVAGDYNFGTIGPKWDTIAERRAFWVATDTIRFDRITSAFTAGAGSVNMLAYLLANAGA